MRFNSQTGFFPQPILRPSGYDSSYDNCDFKFEFSIDGSSSPHKLDITFEIDQSDVLKLVKKGKANVALAIHCNNTYFYDLIDLAFSKNQTVSLDEKTVFGSVYFTLVVKAVKPITGFKPGKLNSSFTGMSFDVEKGDILAISEEHQEVYGLPPLPVGDSIFELVLQAELESDEFSVGLNEPKIQIGVGDTLNQLIQQNMSTLEGRMKNISSIYFPALVDVLYLVQSSDEYQGKAWFEAIGAAMTAFGLEISSVEWEPLATAQKLFRSPFMHLLKSTT